MKYTLRTALICAVILQVFVTASFSASHAFKRTTVGQELDGFVLPTLDGEEVELYPSLASKATLLVFWASWSPRSAEILKDAQTLYEEHGPKEFTVISVNVEHSEWNPAEAEQIRAMGTAAGTTYQMALDKDLEVFNHYGVVAVPSSMILDKDGNVLQMLSGYASMTKADLKDGVLKPLGKYIDPAVANKVDPTIYRAKGKAARHYNMAKRLVKKKRHKRALKPIAQALKEDPDYADAHRLLARIHEKLGDAEKAAAALKKADELDIARGVDPKKAPVAEKKKQSSAAKMLAEKMKAKGESAPVAKSAVKEAEPKAATEAATGQEPAAKEATEPKVVDEAVAGGKAAPAPSDGAKSE